MRLCSRRDVVAASLSIALAVFVSSTAPALAQTDWPKVIQAIAPTVVTIETDTKQGSGFFVSSDGTLVTNHHVIDGAKAVSIRMASGEVFAGGYILATDKARDLAVVRVEAFDVPAAALGNSNEVKAGAAVLLVGAPRGLEQSVSDGIVAALRLDSDGSRLIQTSAPASPGSSGGPLVDSSGHVVGVLTFSVTAGQNLNFAVPINYVRGILERLRTVATPPEAHLAPLVVSRVSRTEPASAARPARAAGGISVRGFGPSEYLQRVYMALTGVLASEGVRVVEIDEVRRDTPVRSIGGLLEDAKAAEAEGLLFFDLSTGWGQTDRLRLQCFDAAGTLLWEDETTSKWQMSVESAVNAVTNRMRDKLRSRIKQRAVPGQTVRK